MKTQFKRRVWTLFGQKFMVDNAWQADLALLDIGPDKKWWEAEPGLLISESKTVTRCYSIDNPQAFYFKRYIYPFKRTFGYWCRTSKAAVELFAYSEMNKLNIACPQVVAFGERRYFGLLFGCFIATKTIPNTQTLSEFALEKWYLMAASEKAYFYQQISEQVIDYLIKAHQGGFFHYDLKWRNILLQEIDKKTLKVIIIDPPRARTSQLLKKWHRVRDLSALARLSVELLTPYQKMRFLIQYLGKNQQKGEAKALYRAIEKHLSRRFPAPLNITLKK